MKVGQGDAARGAKEPVAARKAAAESSSASDHTARGAQLRAFQRYADDSPGVQRLARIQSAPADTAQRVVSYKGKQYNSRMALAADGAASKAFSASKDAKKVDKLTHKTDVYELTDVAEADLVKVEAPVTLVKSAKELRDDHGKSKTTDVALPFALDHYPKESTLYAPIDHAVIVVNDGPMEFVGTSGLIGCVEVLIECHTQRDKGYLVAHVNSHIDNDETEIRRQLTLMLAALSKELDEEISWDQFTAGSTTHKLMLVRQAALGEQRLFLNMRNILAESGATMAAVSSNSVSVQITAEGGNYINNERPDGKKIETDYRLDPGYPKDMLPKS